MLAVAPPIAPVFLMHGVEAATIKCAIMDQRKIHNLHQATWAHEQPIFTISEVTSGVRSLTGVAGHVLNVQATNSPVAITCVVSKCQVDDRSIPIWPFVHFLVPAWVPACRMPFLQWLASHYAILVCSCSIYNKFKSSILSQVCGYIVIASDGGASMDHTVQPH